MSSIFLIDAHVSVYRDLRIAVNLGALVRILTTEKSMFLSTAFRICTGCLAKYELNLLKIGFKNTYFQVFQGFPALKETHAHIQPNGHFDQFLAKMAKTVKIIKKALGTFFSNLQALTNCKVSEKVMNGFRDGRTYERTYVRTDRRDS